MLQFRCMVPLRTLDAAHMSPQKRLEVVVISLPRVLVWQRQLGFRGALMLCTIRLNAASVVASFGRNCFAVSWKIFRAPHKSLALNLMHGARVMIYHAAAMSVAYVPKAI